jgi:hypothetical protein
MRVAEIPRPHHRRPSAASAALLAAYALIGLQDARAQDGEADPSQSVAATPKAPARRPVLQFRVVDKGTDKPLAGAAIHTRPGPWGSPDCRRRDRLRRAPGRAITARSRPCPSLETTR